VLWHGISSAHHRAGLKVLGLMWHQLRSAYDHVATKYEERFIDELDGKPRDRELLDRFATTTIDPVVEVGCGPGQIGAYIRRRGRHVIGVDLSKSMAALARHRLGAAVSADMRRLPCASASVGGVVAFYSIIHMPRPDLTVALQEFERVLRPGGQLVFSAHEGDGEYRSTEFLGEAVPFIASLFTLDELVTATRAARLDVVTTERRAPYATESDTYRLYIGAEKPARP
jgi:SAM-dependent methyltransferase